MRSENARALIAAGKRESPPAALEGAVLGALGVSATALAAPSLATKLWIALKQAAASKVSVGVLAIAAASGGYAAGRMHPREAPSVSTPTTTSAVASTVTAQPTVTATATATAPATATATVPATAPAHQAKPTRKSPSLSDEIASLQRARADLLTGDAKSALDELGLYDDLHPHGELREEALALRVRADRLAGDESAASRALDLLSAEFPRSVQLEALRK